MAICKHMQYCCKSDAKCAVVFTCNIIRGKISLKWTKCTFVLLDGHATLMNNLLFWWLGIFLNHSVASVWCYMAPFLQDKYADTNLPICIATKLTCTKKRYQIRIHVPIKKKIIKSRLSAIINFIFTTCNLFILTCTVYMCFKADGTFSKSILRKFCSICWTVPSEKHRKRLWIVY